ncbi:MAG: 3'-5' exonuclease domain-containing protein 2 [Comamonadaceae bacterium]|nr:MAG: 3'-5' exonuclease domain-containing protein 2 [Comamonadaceae bacterium]
MEAPALPAPEEIALLAPFERLGLERIALVSTAAQAEQAANQLLRDPVWGFDTESRPTFQAGVASEGPHVVQLATLERAYVFQLHDPGCRIVAGELIAQAGVVKAGFGLHDDKRRITHKLGVEPQDVLDLDTVFRQRGYRRQMGIKAAVAVLFGQRYLKSKRAATSNWAHRQLSEAQLLYAANDAWAALRVYHALELR